MWSPGCVNALPERLGQLVGGAAGEVDHVAPEKPYSGNFLVRVGPGLHRKAAICAAADGISLNAWIAKQIQAA